ncbi:MAG: SAM-dependent methyltransferase, partial [Candidatus Dormiibacterota bacterium]
LAGIPLTLRGVASSVAFCTAQHRDGPADLRRLAAAADTLVVLMSLGRAPELAAELAETLGEGRPVAAISCAGTPRERVLRATLSTLAGEVRDARLEAPALLVVGEVAGAGVLRRLGARPETVEIAAAEA